MEYKAEKFSQKKLIRIYRNLIFPRLIEEKMLILLRQGKISKWFSGIGQEAIAVGSTLILDEDEYVLPVHRNLGVFTTRGVDLTHLFAQFMGKKEGFTKGRDRSFHFGSTKNHIVGMISHLGAQLSVADGIALAKKLKGEKKVTIVFTGEGGTSEGEFHEALNIAAVWELPIVFLVENNGYALSTPVEEQFRFKSIAEKGIGYGIESYSIDGNNILEVMTTLDSIVKKIRNKPECALVEARTFRMRGHEEASGVKYVPPELLENWKEKDPITLYENYLLENGIIKQKEIESIKLDLQKEINECWEKAFVLPDIVPNEGMELADVYHPIRTKKNDIDINSLKEAQELRYIDAISQGLDQSMEKFPYLILMGQDIAEYGGAFKLTDGFVKKYGRERVRNTPLCESAVVGMGLGLSIEGYKSVIEMQFADFVSCAFNQIVNNLGKSHYRWGQHSDVVIRMPTGAGLGAGPFHSQSTESWFFHVPGLKIVYPSNPFDAKGLLIAAIEDPNPVLYFEHKFLYRSVKGMVPSEYYDIEIGRAKIISKGDKLTVITYGLGVKWIMDMIEEFERESLEIIDLRSLLPWDRETVFTSVKKTNKVIIIHEDTLTGGIGAEIAASISEYCFEYLDAPVKRIGALDTPVPFNKLLEDDFLPKNRIKKGILEILEY